MHLRVSPCISVYLHASLCISMHLRVSAPPPSNTSPMRSLLSAKAPGKGMPKRVTGRALATSWRMPSSKAAGSVPAVHAAQHAWAAGRRAERARLARAPRQAPCHHPTAVPPPYGRATTLRPCHHPTAVPPPLGHGRDGQQSAAPRMARDRPVPARGVQAAGGTVWSLAQRSGARAIARALAVPPWRRRPARSPGSTDGSWWLVGSQPIRACPHVRLHPSMCVLALGAGACMCIWSPGRGRGSWRGPAPTGGPPAPRRRR